MGARAPGYYIPPATPGGPGDYTPPAVGRFSSQPFPLASVAGVRAALSDLPIKASVAAAVVVALIPLIGGYPDGHDWSIELVRTAEFRNAVAGGQVPPAWAENLYAGYGSPIFLYFPPLYSMLASAFAGITSSIVAGSLLAIALLVLVAAAGMFRLSRLAARWTGAPIPEAAAVGAILLVLHPYLLGDAYLRNASAEFASLCVAPIAIAGVLDLRENRTRGIVWLSGGIALSTIAHNQMALFVAGAVVLIAVALYARHRTELMAAAAGFLLGLVMAAFFWLPAIALLRHVPAVDVLTDSFRFESSFPEVSEIFSYGSFFAAGLLPLAVLAVGTWFAVRYVEQRRVLVVLLAGAALSFFLMLRLSLPLWETIPGLDLFEFPWRFQGPLAIFTAAVGAAVYATWARGRSAKERRALLLGVLVLATANAAPQLGDVQPLDREIQDGLRDSLSAASIREENRTATLVDEYLPLGAQSGVWLDQPVGAGGLVSVDGDADVTVLDTSGTSVEIIVESADAVTVRFGRFEFPGWTARVDGVRTAATVNEVGSIDVPLGAGTHQVRLSYSAPTIRVVATAVSAIGLLLWVGLAIGLWSGRANRRSRDAEVFLESIPERADTSN